MQIATRVIKNGISYATEGLPASLALPTIEGTLIDNWIWLAVTIVLLTTGVLVLWRTWRAAAAYLVLYAGLLLMWSWPVERLLDPLMPFVMLAFLLGARQAVQHLPLRARTPMLAVLVTLLMLGAAKGAIERIGSYRRCDRANPRASAGCYDAETLSKVAASGYIARHSAPGAVVVSHRPATVYFLNGHPGEPDFIIGDAPAGVAARVLRDRNIPYVQLTALHPFEKGPLARGLLNSCQDLVVEEHFPPHALLLSTAGPI